MYSPKIKQCQNCQSSFTIDASDFEFYEKIEVPEPTFCPECRMIRRLSFRNERNFFKRKDDLDGKEIFSMHPPNSEIKVYDNKNWWSDKWDPMDYGRDYDFTRSFFEQYEELLKDVPWISRSVHNSVNCDYSINLGYSKNCYFVFSAGFAEDCAYCDNIDDSKDCFDCYFLRNCELCYEGFMLRDCYKVFFSSYCDDCREIWFCSNCVGCSDCFGCVNLKHKKYHIFNKAYSKKGYFEKLKEFNIDSFINKEKTVSRSKKFWLTHPVKFLKGRKNVDVSGDYIYNSKNTLDSYMVNHTEDSRYIQISFAEGTKDCYDSLIVGRIASLIYECAMGGMQLNNLKFCFECWPDCRSMEYCSHCHSSSDLFACIGLRKKQYCIFNKQYSKEEYEALVPKIKKQMMKIPFTDKRGNVYKYGEFFPPEIFPFFYNHTLANEYFPLTKEEAEKQGYAWSGKTKGEYESTLQANDLPDTIEDVNDGILNEAIECANKVRGECHSSGVFKIVPMELDFYRKHDLPLPRLCPDCRHYARVAQRNPIKLNKRKCMCGGKSDQTNIYQNQMRHSHKDQPCQNSFQTTYTPDREEIVYCEDCYQKEVE